VVEEAGDLVVKPVRMACLDRRSYSSMSRTTRSCRANASVMTALAVKMRDDLVTR